MGEKASHDRILRSLFRKAHLMLLPHNVCAHDFLNKDKRLCHVPLLLRQAFKLRKAEEYFGVTNLEGRRSGGVEGICQLSGACGLGAHTTRWVCWLLMHLVILPRQCSIADLAAALSSVGRILIKAKSKEPVLSYKGGKGVTHGVSHLWSRKCRGLYEARTDIDP